MSWLTSISIAGVAVASLEVGRLIGAANPGPLTRPAADRVVCDPSQVRTITVYNQVWANILDLVDKPESPASLQAQSVPLPADELTNEIRQINGFGPNQYDYLPNGLKMRMPLPKSCHVVQVTQPQS